MRMLLLLLCCTVGLAGNYRFQRFGTDQGLSQDSILTMLEDSHGFIWIGTQDGLNRFDGTQFRNYRHTPRDTTTLSSNFIWCLYEDGQGLLWIGTKTGGLNCYDPKQDSFRSWHSENSKIPNSFVTSIIGGPDGGLYITTHGGGVSYFHPDKGFRNYHEPGQEKGLSDLGANRIIKDQKGRYWVACGSNSYELSDRGGLNLFDPKTGACESFFVPELKTRMSIFSLVEDSNGQLLVGTSDRGLRYFDPDKKTWSPLPKVLQQINGNELQDVNSIEFLSDEILAVGSDLGFFLIDLKKNEYQRMVPDPSDSYSLSEEDTSAVLIDRFGSLWVGTGYSGINRANLAATQFQTIGPKDDGTSYKDDYPTAFTLDHDGYLWVGTHSRTLNRRDPKTGLWETFPKNRRIHQVTGLVVDGENGLWFSTYGGLYCLLADRKTIKHYNHQNSNGNFSDIVDTIFLDKNGVLWAGMEGLIAEYHAELDQFKYYYPYGKEAGKNVRFHEFAHDRDGNLWGASEKGLFMKTADGFRLYSRDPERSDSLPNNEVISITLGSDGYLYLGMQGSGICKMLNAEGGGSFESYNSTHGLLSNIIGSVVDDGLGSLWISSTKGLSRFDLETRAIRNFTVMNGALNSGYFAGAHGRDSEGSLYFGGLRGYTVFKPEDILPDNLRPEIVLTDFLLFNEVVKPGQFPFLKQSLQYTDEIVLNHEQSMFTFEFVGLYNVDAEKLRFAYTLENYNDDWLMTDARKRFATFTNLDAGDYVFRVKAANAEGTWSKEKSVRVRVLPAPWLSWWAKLGYFLLAVLLVAWYLHVQEQKLAYERAVAEKDRRIAEEERRAAETLRQVDRMKDELLANTSHELMTPLNGIIGLAESLRDKYPFDEHGRNSLGLIIAGGQRLTNQVNDLLDYSKLKKQSMQLRCGRVNIRELVETVLGLCEPLLKPEVTFVNQVGRDLLVNLDSDRIQQVLYNLVGNAVKFTEQGEIRVEVYEKEGQVEVHVVDTGIGIAPENIGRIFESFQQEDASTAREYGGTGLGLSISKEIVKMHGGAIWVTSTLGVGSRFIFSLPVGEAPTVIVEEEVEAPQILQQGFTLEAESQGKHVIAFPSGQYSLLIVDDEPMNLLVLREHLSRENLEIDEAKDGTEALLKCEQKRYDLILLDVMMPRVSGYDVCRELREKHCLQELPIIFLTAKRHVGDLLKGFQLGANDYLTKPFLKDEMISRVVTQLKLLNFHRELERLVSERTEELVAAQQNLVDVAHGAGMAELAANIMHSVGNTVNSINTSLHVIQENLSEDTPLRILNKLAVLLNEQSDLAAFLQTDPRGQKVPESLQMLSKKMLTRQNEFLEECGRIIGMVGQISNTLQSQQSHLANHKIRAIEDLNGLVTQVVHNRHCLLEKQGIALTIVKGEIPRLSMDRTKVMRVVGYLIDNACDAIMEKAPEAGGRIEISTERKEDHVLLCVCDNGTGIEEQHMKQIFNYGFTTRKGHQGFGLHYAANILIDMSGSLSIENKEDEGLKVCIKLPIK